MENKIASVISYLLHPILVPFYAVILLLKPSFLVNGIPFQGKLMLLTLVLLTVVLLPLFLMVIYKKMGWISSYYLADKKERKLPLITMGFLQLIMAIMLQRLQISTVFHLFFLTAAVLTVVLLLITNYWKISLHTSAIGGLLGALSGMAIALKVDFILPVLGVVLLAGVVGYARLKLETHNTSQVYVGYIVGFTTVFFFFLFL